MDRDDITTDAASDGYDAGTGDPGDDRTHLQHQAPAQLDDAAIAEHADETDDDERPAGQQA
ncbi:hypothetical protein GCM10022200_14530 [Microbacterium awajiense]|uniref:Uncharacterized protein n=1 Tax=Microbacterium awajiense TaxID=415214 RepID=A0ABP7AI87_9MICO